MNIRLWIHYTETVAMSREGPCRKNNTRSGKTLVKATKHGTQYRRVTDRQPDGQMERQTPHDAKTALCRASSG